MPERTTKHRAAETKRHFSKHETVISLLKHENIFLPHFPTALTRPGFSCVLKGIGWLQYTRNYGKMTEGAPRSFDADVKRRVPPRSGGRNRCDVSATVQVNHQGWWADRRAAKTHQKWLLEEWSLCVGEGDGVCGHLWGQEAGMTYPK